MGSPISTKRTSMQSTKILQKQLLKTRSSLLPAHHVIQRKHLLGVQSKPVSYWQVVRTEGIRRFDFLLTQKKLTKKWKLWYVQYSESCECDFQIPGSRFLKQIRIVNERTNGRTTQTDNTIRNTNNACS